MFETSQVAHGSPVQRFRDFLDNWKLWGSHANLASLVIRVLLSSFVIFVAFALNIHTLVGLFIVSTLLLLLNACVSWIHNAMSD
jgi:hypothetical protein